MLYLIHQVITKQFGVEAEGGSIRQTEGLYLNRASEVAEAGRFGK